MRETRSNNSAGSSRRRGAEAWREIIERYLQSGLTQRVFAQGEGISVSAMQYWLRKRWREELADAAGKGEVQLVQDRCERFMEVRLSGRPELAHCAMAFGGGRCDGGYEVEIGAELRLRFGSGFAEDEVRWLVHLLKGAAGC